MTKLLVGAGLLLLLDSRTTNLLVEAPDWNFDYTLGGDDTAPGWRQYVADGGRTDKAQVELDRLHARSRSFLVNAGATLPDGLDPWLTIVRTRVDERIYLVAEPLVVDHASLAALRPQGRRPRRRGPRGRRRDEAVARCAHRCSARGSVRGLTACRSAR